MAAQNLSQTNPFFSDSLLGRTTTSRNFAPRTKNVKDYENIYKNEVNIVAFFRIFDFSKGFLENYENLKNYTLVLININNEDLQH